MLVIESLYWVYNIYHWSMFFFSTWDFNGSLYSRLRKTKSNNTIYYMYIVHTAYVSTDDSSFKCVCCFFSFKLFIQSIFVITQTKMSNYMLVSVCLKFGHHYMEFQQYTRNETVVKAESKLEPPYNTQHICIGAKVIIVHLTHRHTCRHSHAYMITLRIQYRLSYQLVCQVRERKKCDVYLICSMYYFNFITAVLCSFFFYFSSLFFWFWLLFNFPLLLLLYFCRHRSSNLYNNNTQYI